MHIYGLGVTNVHISQPDEQLDSQSSPTRPNSHENVNGLITTQNAQDCHGCIPDPILSRQVGPKSLFTSYSSDHRSFRSSSHATHIKVTKLNMQLVT